MVNRRSADAKLRRDKKLPETGDENLLDVHVFTSFFFQKLSDGGYSGVRRWTKKVRIILQCRQSQTGLTFPKF